MGVAGRKSVRVEIAAETLTRLLAGGQLCAADLRCLDGRSKQHLWRLCLKSCARKPSAGTRDRPVPGVFCRTGGGYFKGGHPPVGE